MKNGKVVLVGTGFVGMSMAYTMLNRGGVSELVLIDIDQNKIKGEEMDLNHGMPFAPQKMTIRAGDYSDCSDAHVVVITAGIAQKPGQTRLELAETNTRIIKQITQNIMQGGFNGIIIVASNPVDLMTYVASEVSGLVSVSPEVVEGLVTVVPVVLGLEGKTPVDVDGLVTVAGFVTSKDCVLIP